MSEKYTRFVTLLKSIFELDKSDLDFGIYRIINMRKKHIETFLKETRDPSDNPKVKLLREHVQEVLATATKSTEAVEARIAEIEEKCADVGVEPSNSSNLKDEYAHLKAQLSQGVTTAALETDVYSALYNFFSRYYDEGDFISKRRYKEGVYAIPYEGEEVKLYWANHDQYYIKSGENFKDYSFKVDDDKGEKTVHFKLVDASTETANNKENKEKRQFMLLAADAETPFMEEFVTTYIDNGQEKTHTELVLRFTYDIAKDNKADYRQQNLARIIEKLNTDATFMAWAKLLENISSDPKKPKTLLEKHLTAYVAKNSFDFFIHKDLQGFLERELDFFIKSEIMHLDDLDTAEEEYFAAYLAKVRAIKRIGRIIITFLAQIEEFQKKLWLKKKFVVESNYCLTLDHISESLYDDIIANNAQREEWLRLFAIDEINGTMGTGGYSVPLSKDFLKNNPCLVLDTKFFDVEFKEKLLANIDNLDEKTDGLLIHSENFQALNVLQEKYKEQVKCVYIDPPYNTEASEIIYKNGYKKSSWASLITDRLFLGKALQKKDGGICVAIDEFEKSTLRNALESVYGLENSLGTSAVRSNPQGRSTVQGFAVNHEYCLFYRVSNSLKSVGRLDRTTQQIERYNEIDECGKRYLWENFRKTGTDSSKEDRPKQYYPIFVSKKSFRIPHFSWDSTNKEWKLEEICNDNEVVVYPIDDNGNKKVWKWGHERARNSLEHIKTEHKQNGDIQIFRRNYLNDEGALPGTWWDKVKYAAGSHGTNLLTDIFGKGHSFSFPKSVYAVEDCVKVISDDNSLITLDYFAGSGTTAHAVIDLNREDEKNGINGKRKYILVEMGEYFDTVTKPRVQKVIYSDEWKNGKPTTRKGSSHIMKYMRLESYEDALNNIVLDDTKNKGMMTLLGDEYLLKYMLHEESGECLLNFDMFKNPFAYTLNITEKNESKKRVIDLCESFNYLIGLYVDRVHETKRYTAKSNPKGEYPGAVTLTAESNGVYAFKMYEGKLRTGEKTLIIWRTLSDDIIADNAALDAFFLKNFINTFDREFDRIYINGDNTIENLRLDDETWKVSLIEIEMKKRLFEEK